MIEATQYFRWFAITFLAFAGPLSGEVYSQQSTLVPPQEAPVRSSSKVELPALSTEELPREGVKSSIRGHTFVALAPGLDRVFEGYEPTTLQELKRLEAQQTLVAQKIDQVTVNVQQGAAQGSGVIITPDGYVLTAAHVAGDKNRDAWLILSDGSRVKARTLGMNRNKDAGLLKIVERRSEPWPHATLGKSHELQVGQWVVASGHPGGWKPNRGTVIRVGRVLKIRSEKSDAGINSPHTLFTDCALIGGDSGGPLFTLEGKLVGIHSRIGINVDDNMHVPIDVFDESWDRMVQKEVWGMLPGYQPVIGVKGYRTDDRPLLESVHPGGPAHRAGLKAGDMVLKFDGVAITTFEELRLGVESKLPGDTIVLTVQRGERLLRIPVIVGVASG